MNEPRLDLSQAVLDRYYQAYDREGFAPFLSEILFGARYNRTDLGTCGRCSRPVLSTTRVDGQYDICHACLPTYPTCQVCGARTATGRSAQTYAQAVARTHGNGTTCRHCRDRLFTAHACGYYLPNGQTVCACQGGQSQQARETSCCSSPAQSFTLRNDGLDPVSNDTPFSITLPGGEINAAGIRQIRGLLADRDMYDAYDLVPELGAEWQNRNGTWTRRLSRALYQSTKGKIPDDVMSAIGNIARDNTPDSLPFDLEITRDLNQSAAAFGHAGSCYWNGYTSSRCTLKTNGAFALRSFSTAVPSPANVGGDASCDCSAACVAETARRLAVQVPAEGARTVSGRVWVQPVRMARTNWHPTFDTEAADGFVVFNGYGDLQNYGPARIIAHMTGLTYRKVEFHHGAAYINAGGYLVAPETLTSAHSVVNLQSTAHSNVFQVEAQKVKV